MGGSDEVDNEDIYMPHDEEDEYNDNDIEGVDDYISNHR